jgi:adenosine deaminase
MTNNNNITEKGNTMNNRTTYQETIVKINDDGIELCSPRYGHRWSINAPHKREGWRTTMHIGSQQDIQKTWDAYYKDN